MKGSQKSFRISSKQRISTRNQKSKNTLGQLEENVGFSKSKTTQQAHSMLKNKMSIHNLTKTKESEVTIFPYFIVKIKVFKWYKRTELKSIWMKDIENICINEQIKWALFCVQVYCSVLFQIEYQYRVLIFHKLSFPRRYFLFSTHL